MGDEFDCIPGSGCCSMCSTFSCDCREWKMKAKLQAQAEKIKRLREVLVEIKHQRHHTIDEEVWRIDQALSESKDNDTDPAERG